MVAPRPVVEVRRRRELVEAAIPEDDAGNGQRVGQQARKDRELHLGGGREEEHAANQTRQEGKERRKRTVAIFYINNRPAQTPPPARFAGHRPPPQPPLARLLRLQNCGGCDVAARIRHSGADPPGGGGPAAQGGAEAARQAVLQSRGASSRAVPFGQPFDVSARHAGGPCPGRGSGSWGWGAEAPIRGPLEASQGDQLGEKASVVRLRGVEMGQGGIGGTTRPNKNVCNLRHATSILEFAGPGERQSDILNFNASRATAVFFPVLARQCARESRMQPCPRCV